jgi:uncharacterized heparinase superfamily protein
LILYVNPLGYVPAWSHGHADLGGFILEWNDKALLVDCGRSTYQPTEWGRYGRSVRSHNAITIDSYEPCVTHAYNGFVPPMLAEYCGKPPRVQVDRAPDSVRIRVDYYGFQRLQDELIVTRVFEVSQNQIRILDEISGNGTHLVETFFHLHPDIGLLSQDKNGVELAVGSERVSLVTTEDATRRVDIFRGEDGSQPAGWFSGRYGESLPTITLRYQQKTALPVRNAYTIARA